MGENQPHPRGNASAARRLAREWPWLLAIGVGAWLRGYGLLDQLPVDDEWHALHGLLLLDYGQIATSFGPVDRCIPLTLALKLAAASAGLGDGLLRLPSFAVGILTLVLCPWLLRPQLGRRGSHLFAALLAVAPLLVFYGRSLRPYGLGALLGFVCLALFERWWRTGLRRHAVGYGACAALASWILLSVAPFVLAPLALGFAAALRSPARLVARLGAPALAFAAFALPLLGPPLLAHPEALLAKLGAAPPEAGSLARGVGFLLGTRSSALALLLLTLSGVGALRLWRLAPTWTGLALGASALAIVAVGVSAPRHAGLGFVLGRYALPALPVLLCCAAAALDAAGRLAGPLGTALCGVWLWSSGVPALLWEDPSWFPGRWVTAMEGVAPEPRRVPEFYAGLARAPAGSLTLVESPWYYSLWNNLLPAYTRVHRQRVLIGMTNGLCTTGHWGEYPPDAGIALRGFVPLADAEALRARGADYVVFHRDLAAELARVVDPVDLRATGQPDVTGCIDAFRARGWPEVYDDAALVVFARPGLAGPPAP